jgi:hypothetical protein
MALRFSSMPFCFFHFLYPLAFSLVLSSWFSSDAICLVFESSCDNPPFFFATRVLQPLPKLRAGSECDTSWGAGAAAFFAGTGTTAGFDQPLPKLTASSPATTTTPNVTSHTRIPERSMAFFVKFGRNSG